MSIKEMEQHPYLKIIKCFYAFSWKKQLPVSKRKSNVDVEFEDGTRDEVYLNTLYSKLPKIIKEVKPNFIFYLSGVDVIKNDKLGRLSLSLEGCYKRDLFVFEQCKENNLPVQVSMGGGYSSVLKEIIDAHVNTFKIAQQVFF